MEEKKTNKLKVYCVENGISGKELAELLGKSPITIYQYFSGARRPGHETMQQMSKLGININEVFFDKEKFKNEDWKIKPGMC